MRLNVDLSWYTRYRSSQNPDFGVNFKGPFTIHNEPTIPLSDTDSPPDQAQPVPRCLDHRKDGAAEFDRSGPAME
jgi:hypothetical protein